MDRGHRLSEGACRERDTDRGWDGHLHREALSFLQGVQTLQPGVLGWCSPGEGGTHSGGQWVRLGRRIIMDVRGRTT